MGELVHDHVVVGWHPLEAVAGTVGRTEPGELLLGPSCAALGSHRELDTSLPGDGGVEEVAVEVLADLACDDAPCLAVATGRTRPLILGAFLAVPWPCKEADRHSDRDCDLRSAGDGA